MAQALRRRTRDSKSPEAFRTISEVALELEVPQHVLRFWESKFSQIKPLKRGGGRRYYRPIDVDLLKGIRRLLYNDGYTIKGVQKLLRQHGARWVIASVKKDGAEAAPGADDRLGRVTARAGEAGGQLSVSQKAQISALLGELRAVRNLLRTTD